MPNATIHSARPSGWASKYSVTGTIGQPVWTNRTLDCQNQPWIQRMVIRSTFQPSVAGQIQPQSFLAMTQHSRITARYFNEVHPRHPAVPAPAWSKCTWVVLVVTTLVAGERPRAARPSPLHSASAHAPRGTSPSLSEGWKHEGHLTRLRCQANPFAWPRAYGWGLKFTPSTSERG